MAVSENGKLQFSKDGGRLFFGIAAAPKPEPKDAAEPIKVDIWNWRDPFLQPMQKSRAEEEKKRTLMCVVHLLPKEKKFVPLATADMPEITLSEDAKVALGSSDLAYRQLVSWDRPTRTSTSSTSPTARKSGFSKRRPTAPVSRPAGPGSITSTVSTTPGTPTGWPTAGPST